MNNEKFIKKREKEKQKGKIKYVLTASIIMGIIWLVGSIIGISIKEGDFFSTLIEYNGYIYFAIGGFIGGGISSLAKWNMDEEKYNNLISNE